jgi:hypothetical protein
MTFAGVGYDEVYVRQIGPKQDDFFDFGESDIAAKVV